MNFFHTIYVAFLFSLFMFFRTFFRCAYLSPYPNTKHRIALICEKQAAAEPHRRFASACSIFYCSRFGIAASTTSKCDQIARIAASASCSRSASTNPSCAQCRTSACCSSVTMRTYIVLIKSLTVASIAPNNDLISLLPDASHSKL